MQQDSEGFDLEQALSTLRRRSPLILLCVVLAAGAAFGFSKQQTKKYAATASLTFSNNSLSQEVAGLPASSSSASLAAQQANNLQLVKLGDMATKTAGQVGHGLTGTKVASDLNITGAGESSVVDVSATAISPTIAAAIANAYTHQFVKEQQSANRRYFKSALALVNKQLGQIPPRQRFGAGAVALQNRAQTLRLLSELQYGNVQVAQEAVPPTGPSSPKTSRNTALGALLGLLIGLGLAFALERLDRRIKGPEDVEEIYRLPLLGVVPQSAALSRAAQPGGGERAALPPAEAEAFSLIRAHLRFFNVDRDLRTIVVASAAPDDGKTVIARHLAEAAARLGSRVLLLEVDLRNPKLAEQLDIQSGPGLADVLIGAILMGEATQSVDLKVLSDERSGRHTLDVLPAGAVLPPNPGELLESRAMNTLLERAKSAYDLVVIDTPPLTAVSDAFPLLTKVDGVVVVSRVGRSRRDIAERLHQVLASSGAPLLGVIANGSKASKSSGPNSYTHHARGDNDKASHVVASSSNGAAPSEELVPQVRT